MATVIIGGSRGLGLSLAGRLAAQQDETVIVTGRTKLDGHQMGREEIEDDDIGFVPLKLNRGERRLRVVIEEFCDVLPFVDLLVYNPGFRQQQSLVDIPIKKIYKMLEVGEIAPILLVRELLIRQGVLPGLIAITSTSQVRPRPNESVYAAAKSGFGHFIHSMSFTDTIGRTLCVAPGGMNTAFWDGSDVVAADWLDPADVATVIVRAWDSKFQRRRGMLIDRDLTTGRPKVKPLQGWKTQ